jgi:hypothetical protein
MPLNGLKAWNCIARIVASSTNAIKHQRHQAPTPSSVYTNNNPRATIIQSRTKQRAQGKKGQLPHCHHLPGPLCVEQQAQRIRCRGNSWSSLAFSVV